MTRHSHTISLLAITAATLVVGVASAMREPQERVSYNRDVRPIVSDKCFRCHGTDASARQANLRLDNEKDSRRAIVPGNAPQSRVYQRITDPNPARRMPPADSHLTLTKPQIDLLRRWILQGARFEQHWSFIPPTRPTIPKIRNPQSAIRNPIDAFITARLDKEGLSLSPQAPKEKLLRRVTMDITGIPPTLEELDAFLADRSPNAYDKVVDRLLTSPRFGERWAWEWLEAARYSDTNGYQEDRTRTMWPWRDWVINAINSDMPFDQFTVEQLAGDLLPNATFSQKIATGFNRNHMLNGEGGRIAEESRVDYVVDRVDTTATLWQGLTLGCARCHDHKYDPFSQREYYQLYAYFNNVSESGSVDAAHSANPIISLPSDEQKQRMAELEAQSGSIKQQLIDIDKKLRAAQPDWEKQVVSGASKPPEKISSILAITLDKRTDEQKKELETYYFSLDPARSELRKKQESVFDGINAVKKEIPLAMVMDERKEPRDSFILLRGAYDKYGEKVTSAVPATLNPLPEGLPNNRLALAKWLVDPRNPLTARVTVNRVWQQLFGTGLVKTSEDFGIQGEPPSHPELLDWLAVEFMNPGVESPRPETRDPRPWSIKRLIKLIVTSATYRQDSRTPPKLLERDPGNRLLARGPRFRWPSFVLRDQALALSGLLVEKVGGPSVKPYQPDGVWEDFSYGKITYARDSGEGLYRRSLYTFWRRSVAPPTMFDTAARRVCIVRTERTNTPLQALNLMNDIQYVEAASFLAERAMKASSHPKAVIAYAFRQATSRRPASSELAVLENGFRRNLNRFHKDPESAQKLLSVGEKKRNPSLNPSELAAYTTITSTILNLDETLSKE